MNIAICDDNIKFCSILENVVFQYGSQHQYKFEIEVYYSGEELYRHMSDQHYYDIIFLDIEMQQMNGIEVGLNIRNALDNEAVHIVYISSYSKYAMDLFQVRPFDFIMKPFNIARIYHTLDQSIKLTNKNRKMFHYKVNKLTYSIPFENILYFESVYNKKIKIVHTGGESIFYGSLTNIMEDINKPYFYHVHRCFIINIQFIRLVDKQRITMKNQHQIPIPVRKQNHVTAFLKDYEEHLR